MTARSLSQAPSGTMDETPARGIIVGLAASAILWAIGAAVWSALI